MSWTQNFLREADRTEDYDNPMYQEIAEKLGYFYTCRTLPTPDCFTFDDCKPTPYQTTPP